MQVYCAGSNSHGQLGVGDDHDRHRWTRSQVPSVARVTPCTLACGANHTLWLDRVSGHVLGAGGNQRGQRGAGTPADTCATAFSHLDVGKLVDQAGVRGLVTERYTVQGVAAAWETSFLVLRPGDPSRSDVVLSTGANDWGERGRPGADPHTATRIELEDLAPPEVRGQPLRVIQLQAGPRHVVALVQAGEVVDSESARVASSSTSLSSSCRRVLVGWGASRQGQLGSADPQCAPPRLTSTPQPVVLPAPYQPDDVCSFSLGKDHTAFVLRERSRAGTDTMTTVAVLLGSDKHGQLGASDHGGVVEPPRLFPRFPANSARPRRSNVLRVEDLMDENEPDRARWRLVGVHCTWSSTFCHLEYQPTLPTHGSPSEPTRTRIVGFGRNAHGQLGARTVARPTGATSLPSSSSLDLAHKVTQLSCGSEHVLALLETHEVMGWGWNEHGNLGLEAANPTPVTGEHENATALESPSVTADALLEKGILADVWQPRRIWPPDGRSVDGAGKAVRIAAGNATSWIMTSRSLPCS